MSKLKTQFNDLVEAPAQPQWNKVLWSDLTLPITISELTNDSEVYVVINDTDANYKTPFYMGKIFDSYFDNATVYVFPVFVAGEGLPSNVNFSFTKSTKTFADFADGFAGSYITQLAIFYR